MIRLARLFRDYRECGSMQTLVPVHAVVDDKTFVTKGGDLLQCLALRGLDADCLEPAELDRVCRRFEAVTRSLDERTRVYQYLMREDAPAIPHQAYGRPWLDDVIAERMAFLRQPPKRLASLTITYVIAYEGWRPDGRRASFFGEFLRQPRQAILSRLSATRKIAGMDEELERACERLRRAVETVASQLQDIVSVASLDTQQAYRFFRSLVNSAPSKVDVPLGYHDHVDFQMCDSTLECYRDHLRLDGDYVQVLTLKTPPVSTCAHLLRALQAIPGCWSVVTEWKRENPLTMRRLIQAKRRHFHNSRVSLTASVASEQGGGGKSALIDDGAVAVVSELGACLEEMEVNGRHFGQFSLSIVLRDSDWTALRSRVAQCVKILGIHDAQLTEERPNLLNAWAAVLPGNHAYNLRRLFITNTNYADLAFLFAPSTGEPRNLHLNAEYLTALESNGEIPYLFNLHHQDNGHTFITGATGSGKSFLVKFLLTFLQKYDPFIYVFDLGGSYRTLTRQCEGSYVPLGSRSRHVTINPFCLDPSPDNLGFLFAFCKVLIESAGYRMSAPEDRDLAEQIENLYQAESSQRRLRTLANILPRALRLQLLSWTEGGPHGDLFDHADDTLTFSRFQTFDFEGFDTQPDLLEPLLFYILHRANAIVYDAAHATTLKLFVLDEAWRFFRHPTICAYLIEGFKTWRKKNAAVLLATQSLDDLRRSELLPVVVESCATQMFLANPGMDIAAYRETFHLNATEAAAVARLIPRRQLLLKRPGLSTVLNLIVPPDGAARPVGSLRHNPKTATRSEATASEPDVAHLGRRFTS